MILNNVQLLINAAFHQWTQFCLQTLTFGQIFGPIGKKKKTLINCTLVHHCVIIPPQSSKLIIFMWFFSLY